MTPAAVPPGGGRSFELDRFQHEAIAALDRGENVLVAAPTGSGKTVVAEHAVDLALAAGAKAFYTAPIKALSNQKHRDLAERVGVEQVGLLTGDTTHQPDAPVVVMTTEVLRNMLYRRAPALDGLRWVVLDEVHFLQDEYRGPVWEEVMIHLPPEVRLVCLSATVSNSDELGEWITTVRGPTTVVLEERRPVSLTNHYAVEVRDRRELVVIPTLVRGKPNPEGDAFDAGGTRERGRGRGRPRRAHATPRRLDVVDHLARLGLLPAIYFIFSRAACDDAVRACTAAGLRLTTPDERRRVRAIVEERTAALDPLDLAVLGYERWVAALESGVAAHHAGMVPPFKEAVEACFVEGLVKAVFATETLALGINMPARTVVIEKLTKFNGETHEPLTPAQYTQLTGRAGRRGIDPDGHAVVLWSPFVPFAAVAHLAASREFVLTSAFRPTYNMAANLVRRYDAEQAHHLLNLSFAQFQADRAVVRSELDLSARRADLERARSALEDAVGGAAARALVGTPDDADEVTGPEDPEVVAALAALVPGQVIELPTEGGRQREVAAVVSVAHRGGSLRVRAVTATAQLREVTSATLTAPPAVVDEIRLPVPFAPRHVDFQREVASRLSRRGGGLHAEPPPGAGTSRGADDAAVARLVRRVRRLERRVAAAESQARRRTESLARRFDGVLSVLDAWGHVDGWALTEKGERLASIYHECDLLIAEALAEGIFDGLDPAALAGLASCLTYEHRSAAPPPEPWFPSARVAGRVHRLAQLASEIAADEEAARLPMTRPPDPGFFALAHAWAAGEDLDVVLDDEVMSAGDFVRNMKQLVDLLRQIAAAAPTADLATTAHEAVGRVQRGLVLASTVVAT